MRVFSASIESFLQRLTLTVRQILRDEFRVEVARTRFTTPEGWSWPIRLVAIDDAQRLGYFDPDHCVIAIHRRLMVSAKDRVLKNLLRHELAHYFTYIAYHESGLEDRPHGPQFQSICTRYGLGDEVRRSTCDVAAANDEITGELENEATLARIRRLLALAQSDNEHEAALAVLRANELMVRHNLEAAALARDPTAETEYCVKCLIACKRSSPRISAIAEILAAFFVYPVQTSSGLEVTGTRANVEQAQYIADVLDRALAASWKRARAAQPAKRLRQKPFMDAAAAAYLAKLQRAKTRYPAVQQRALALLDDELAWAGRGSQGGHLHTATSWYEGCEASSAQGARAGTELEIARAVGANARVKQIEA